MHANSSGVMQQQRLRQKCRRGVGAAAARRLARAGHEAWQPMAGPTLRLLLWALLANDRYEPTKRHLMPSAMQIYTHVPFSSRFPPSTPFSSVFRSTHRRPPWAPPNPFVKSLARPHARTASHVCSHGPRPGPSFPPGLPSCRSRLGCQIVACKELDGLVVRIPSATRNMAVDGFRPKPH